MGIEQGYTLVSNNRFTLVTGTAREVVDYLSSTDTAISDLHLTEKPRVYWKEGLSDKATKV